VKDSDYTVNNVAPVVSSVTLNGGSDMTLTSEESTTNFVLGATVTDNNGCADITTVLGYLYEYQSGVLTWGDCDTSGESDGDDCYPEITCTIAGGNTCDGGTDTSASYQCTAVVEYYADPTTAGAPNAAYTWRDTLKATDDDAVDGSTETSSTIEMNTFLAMNITGNITYDNLSAGQDTGTLNESTVTTATGNLSIDEEVSGTQMCPDYPTCAGDTISVGNQEYSTTASVNYGSGTDLTGSAVTVTTLNCPKTTSAGQGTANTYWGIAIPSGIGAGAYTGVDTVNAVVN